MRDVSGGAAQIASVADVLRPKQVRCDCCTKVYLLGEMVCQASQKCMHIWIDSFGEVLSHGGLGLASKSASFVARSSKPLLVLIGLYAS